MSSELSDQEQIVLNTVLEYLDKNRQFNMRKIIPFIKSRFKLSSVNISENGIYEHLRSLVKMKFIIDGSKLSREEILINRKRNRIYSFIQENPGINFIKIVEKLDLSHHVVTWHLKMLVLFDYIKKETLENLSIYFDSNINFEEAKLNYYASKERTKRIIKLLSNNESGTTKTELARTLNMHMNTITKYLNEMEDLKLIYKKKSLNTTIYLVNEKFLLNQEYS